MGVVPWSLGRETAAESPRSLRHGGPQTSLLGAARLTSLA